MDRTTDERDSNMTDRLSIYGCDAERADGRTIRNIADRCRRSKTHGGEELDLDGRYNHCHHTRLMRWLQLQCDDCNCNAMTMTAGTGSEKRRATCLLACFAKHDKE